MKQFIRKADIILFIVLVATGLAASAALTLSHSDAGSDAKVIIESGGSLYARYPLYEDRIIVVPAPKQTGTDASESYTDDQGTDTNASAASGDTFTDTDTDTDSDPDPGSGPGSAGSDDHASGSSDHASVQYDHYNVVEVRDGTVSVTEASCKNQVCVRHNSISKRGESIVCLPNRLVVSIENGSGEGGGYDEVTS